LVMARHFLIESSRTNFTFSKSSRERETTDE
jgi:hypothetical protein